MPQRSEEAKKLLHQVADQIDNSPRHYDQEQWVTHNGGLEDAQSLEDINNCGTQACIAGWTVLIDAVNKGFQNYLPPEHRIGPRAANLLELSDDEETELFSESWVPKSLEITGSDYIDDMRDELAIHTAKALREIAGGASVESVSALHFDPEPNPEDGPPNDDHLSDAS